MKNKLIILSSIIFICFALLQVNDTDAYIWILAYLIPAILSIFTYFNYKFTFYIFISLIYLLIGVYIYFNSNETAVMNILSEKNNESLGLLFCSIWIGILHLYNKIDPDQ